MVERSASDTYLRSVERHLAELEAEARSCDDPDEHRAIAADVRGERAVLSRSEAAGDLIASLPDLWASIYGEEATDERYVALFSGLRTPGAARLAAISQAYFAWPSETRAAQQWVSQAAADEREVYHCAHLLIQPRRRKANAAPLSALYVDLDDGALSAEVSDPTLIVESSPNRYQAYWALSEAVDPSVGESLNRRLAFALGADRAGWDLTQLLRVPGTANHKYPDAPLVRVWGHSDHTYHVDELMVSVPELPNGTRALGPLLGEHQELRVPEPVWVPEHLSTTAQRIWDGIGVRHTRDGRVDRSAALVQIARVLHGAGMTPEEIAVALAERDATLGWRKYTDRPDAPIRYDAVARLVASRKRR